MIEPPLDQRRVEAFLAVRSGGKVTDAAPLEGGAWSSPYGFRDGSRQLVIRFSAVDEDFRKDEIAARLGSEALPIPAVLEIGEAFGGFYAISERRFGTYLEATDETQLRARLPALFAALDAMREADVSTSAGYGSWGVDGMAHHRTWRDALLAVAEDRPTLRIHGWRERLAASAIGERPFDEAHRTLRALAGDLPEARHLIHSDLVNKNTLVDGQRITAVLDWGSALYGDFLFDLAWIWFWAPWYSAWARIDFRAEAARHYDSIGLRVERFEERMRACAIYIGLDGQTYQAWKGLWSDLEWTAHRTLEVAGAGPG